MRTFLKIILGLVVLGAIAFGVVMYMTSNTREIARQFVIQASSGGAEDARMLMHDALIKQFPDGKMSEAMAGVRPYTEVSFGSVETSAGVTKLEGTATTADGCSSAISFELVKDQITAFNIAPLCRD